MLDAHERHLLLEVARGSIVHGLTHGHPVHVDPEEFPAPLREARASFVTLENEAGLRGCIGVLEPFRALVLDVARNAHAAAFSDPRFPPLSPPELEGLSIHISVLSVPEPLQVSSEADLLAQLRPGVDGLILREGAACGTFLPSVWTSLPRPEDFIAHLKLKAGLPVHHWSPRVQVERYTTESFG